MVFSTIHESFDLTSGYVRGALNSLIADAALLVTGVMTDKGLEMLRGRPVVLLNSCGKGFVSSVTHNYALSVTEAMERLIQNGHTEIGYIGYDFNSYAENERRHSFHQEVRRQNLPFVPNWEIFTKDRQPDIKNIFENPQKPTALIISSIELVPPVMQFLADKGLKVPADMSLCVMDMFMESSDQFEDTRHLVSGYSNQWEHLVRTAIQELIALIGNDHHVRHIEPPQTYLDQGSIAAISS